MENDARRADTCTDRSRPRRRDIICAAEIFVTRRHRERLKPRCDMLGINIRETKARQPYSRVCLPAARPGCAVPASASLRVGLCDPRGRAVDCEPLDSRAKLHSLTTIDVCARGEERRPLMTLMQTAVRARNLIHTRVIY